MGEIGEISIQYSLSVLFARGTIVAAVDRQLKQAHELIKSGQKQQAVAILKPILKTDRDNAGAWWLLAHAVDSQEHARKALENVLRIRPDDEKARAKLAGMTRASSTRTTPAPARPSRNSLTAPPDPFLDDDAFDEDPFAVLDSDDPFADIDDGSDPFGSGPRYSDPDPFSDMSKVNFIEQYRKPERAAAKPAKKSGSNVPFILMATVMALVGLGVVVYLLMNLDTVANSISGDDLPSNYLDFGVSKTGRTGSGESDEWFFEFDGYPPGTGIYRIAIEVNGRTATSDPVVELYDPQGNLIASDDQSGGANNARIVRALPRAGTYRIVVGGWRGGELSYEVTLRRLDD